MHSNRGYDSRGQGGEVSDLAVVAPWFDHTAADVATSRRRGTRIAEEEVRLGVTNGGAHDLWQLPVDLD